MSKPLIEIPFISKNPLSPIRGTNVLSVYENRLEYNGKDYFLEELDGVSTKITKHYVNGIYTGTNYSHVIHFDSGSINISFRQARKNTDNISSYGKLIRLTEIFLNPIIVNRVVRTVFSEGEYRVGKKIVLTPNSVQVSGLFGSRKELSYGNIKSWKILSGVMILTTTDNRYIRTALGINNALLLPDIIQSLYNANNKTF